MCPQGVKMIAVLKELLSLFSKRRPPTMTKISNLKGKSLKPSESQPSKKKKIDTQFGASIVARSELKLISSFFLKLAPEEDLLSQNFYRFKQKSDIKTDWPSKGQN